MHAIKAIDIEQGNFSVPGEKIRVLRQKLGINQRDFAWMAKMSPSALNRIESGQNVHPRNIVEISELLGIHPRELSFNKKDVNDDIEDDVLFIKRMFPNKWKQIGKEIIKEM